MSSYRERGERALNAARDVGAAAIVASDIGTVTWLTGMTGDLEASLAPWSAGAYAAVASGGMAIVWAAEDEGNAPGRRAFR